MREKEEGAAGAASSLDQDGLLFLVGALTSVQVHLSRCKRSRESRERYFYMNDFF